VTVKAFTVSDFSTLTCFGHYRPSSEGTSILSETTITVYALTLKTYTYTIIVKYTLKTRSKLVKTTATFFGVLKFFKSFC
jgi:hypothetical protein